MSQNRADQGQHVNKQQRPPIGCEMDECWVNSPQSSDSVTNNLANDFDIDREEEPDADRLGSCIEQHKKRRKKVTKRYTDRNSHELTIRKMTTRKDLMRIATLISLCIQNTSRAMQKRRNNNKLPDDSTTHKIKHQPWTSRIRD